MKWELRKARHFHQLFAGNSFALRPSGPPHIRTAGTDKGNAVNLVNGGFVKVALDAPVYDVNQHKVVELDGELSQ